MIAQYIFFNPHGFETPFYVFLKTTNIPIMNRIITILFSLLSSFSIHSQGTLQFNKVITGFYSAPALGYFTPPQDTVPAGKVWKIEKILPCECFNTYIYLNNVQFQLCYNGAVRANMDDRLTPLWLKAGDTFRVWGHSPAGGATRLIVSIIEFNILP